MTGFPSFSAIQHPSAVLRALSYSVASASVAGIPSFTEDIFLVMRFGNDVTVATDGALTLPVTCALRLRDGGPFNQVSRWTIGKSFLLSFSGKQIRIPLHLDVAIAGSVSPAFFDQHISHSYAHLRNLIADARETLTELPRGEYATPVRGNSGPVVHIETVAVGDLVAGRSGLLKSSRASFAVEDIALRLRACDLLEWDVLPDVAAALHAVVRTIGPMAASSSNDAQSSVVVPNGNGCQTAKSIDRSSAPCINLQH
jgi:hypothetical protein